MDVIHILDVDNRLHAAIYHVYLLQYNTTAFYAVPVIHNFARLTITAILLMLKKIDPKETAINIDDCGYVHEAPDNYRRYSGEQPLSNFDELFFALSVLPKDILKTVSGVKEFLISVILSNPTELSTKFAKEILKEI